MCVYRESGRGEGGVVRERERIETRERCMTYAAVLGPLGFRDILGTRETVGIIVGGTICREKKFTLNT